MKACIVLVAGLFVSSVAAAAPRPNILFAFADDWGRIASAFAAVDPGGIHEVVRTPNFDRVARDGVLFTRAFVSSPSCTPCRSALISGQHFWRTGRGAILVGAVWDPLIPAFPTLLRDGGYHIGKTYKVWGPGAPRDVPFDPEDHWYEAAGRRFNQFSQHATRLLEAGRSIEMAKQELYAEVRANFDAFLADRSPNQPFFYWWGPTNTHRKWIQGSGRTLWGIEPDLLTGRMPPFLPDVPAVREDLADYLGEVQAFDAGLGVLLARLEELGELDNTIVVVSGDHGPPGFPYGKCNLYDFGSGVALAVSGPGVSGGRVVEDLISLTDLAPTFLEVAGAGIPGNMTGRSMVRLLASSRSGYIEPERDAVFIGRERHVDYARAGHLPYPQRAIRTRDFLYIVNFEPARWPLGDPYRLDGPNPPTPEEVREQTGVTLADEDAGPTKAWMVTVRNDPAWARHFEWVYGKRPREELYDLRSDPHQVQNVAQDPGYDGIRIELERRLMDELHETGDPRVVDGGRYFETPPLAGPP